MREKSMLRVTNKSGNPWKGCPVIINNVRSSCLNNGVIDLSGWIGSKVNILVNGTPIKIDWKPEIKIIAGTSIRVTFTRGNVKAILENTI